MTGVVITDGSSTDPRQLKKVLGKVQNTDIHMMAIGKPATNKEDSTYNTYKCRYKKKDFRRYHSNSAKF